MNRNQNPNVPQTPASKVKMREFHYKTGGCFVVMEDKYRIGRWAFGVSPARDVPMKFYGNYESYNAAHIAGRQRYRQFRSAIRRRGAK